MALDNDRTLSQLCDQREDLRVQLSIETDAPRPDNRHLLIGHAKLILLRPRSWTVDACSAAPRPSRRRGRHAPSIDLCYSVAGTMPRRVRYTPIAGS
jgi:hypothetical protein